MNDTNNNQVQPGSNQKSKLLQDSLFFAGIFITMIAGMIAKVMHDNIQSNVDVKWDILGRGEFLIPLLVSPIVFGGIYGMIKGTPKNLGTFIFAFQNGFFWKTIFGQTNSQFEQ